MQEPKVGRRIVSRGEYMKVQVQRTGVALESGFLLLTCFVCGFLAFVSCISGVMNWASLSSQADGVIPYDPATKILILVCVVFALVLGAACHRAHRMYENGLERLSSMNTVVPLTRANTAALAANDSLVRASKEPAQAQEGVLLRAASGEAQAGREGQLLRAAQE